MKTKTRFVSILLVTLMLLTLLSACGEKTQPASGKSDTSEQEQSETPEQTPTKKTDDETNEEPEFIATLVADMSFGSGDEELILKYEYSYNGSISVAILAQGLSELTGLNFAVNDSKDDSSNVSVDWSHNAAFIAGLGETQQKDEFFVYNSESLTWFMLNSMYRTILENLGGRLEVFYSMDGGNPMMNEVFAAEGGFPVDLPYTGSHDGRGDIFDDDFAEHDNNWLIDWLGEYKNADETKTLIISHVDINREGIPYFNFLLTAAGEDEFDGLAAFDADGISGLARYMDLTFAMGNTRRGYDVTIWQDEPYDDGYEREIFVTTYFSTNLEEDDGGFPYWSGFNFGPNLSYEEEFETQSDPGESMNAAEAAKMTFDTVRDNGNISEYSDDTQYTMVLVDLTDIEGEECYVYRMDVDEPTGTIGAAYAYAYQSGNIYMQGYGGQWLLISSAKAFG